MKKVCITGADGFVGRVLLKHCLDNKYEVWAVGLNKNNILISSTKKIHFIKARFEEYTKLLKLLPRDLDYFFHLAWSGPTTLDAHKDYGMQISNAKYACDALMIAVKLKCKRFIFVSTINVLETKRYMNLDSFKPRYTNIYATSKIASEMICKTLAYQNHIHFNCGMIAMIYGEGSNPNSTVPHIIIKNLLNNIPSDLLPYNTPYDLIYVGDVADALIAIANKGKDQKTYYVGHSKLSTFGKLFTDIKKIVNPKGVLNFGVFPLENAIDYSLIDLKALEKDTKFIPKADFRQSILTTTKWIKECTK